MSPFFKKIFIICLIVAALPAVALANNQVDLQLQINPANPVGGNGGGGGGGGIYTPPIVNAPTTPANTITGWTSSNALVEAIIAGRVVGSTVSQNDGSFILAVTPSGNEPIFLRSIDIFGAVVDLGRTIDLTGGASATANTLLPPTFSMPAAVFPAGAQIVGDGRTVPGGVISVVLTAANGKQLTLLPTVGSDGDFKVSFDTKGLASGAFTLQISLNYSGKSASLIINGTLGKTALPPPPNLPTPKPGTCDGTSDLNCDGDIDLQDVSIMLFYFGKTNFPSRYDLNHDGKINLIDFSIMLYYLNQPARGTLGLNDLSIATVNGDAPITLDVGRDENGDWLAAWNTGSGLAEVKSVQISTDNGASWRPAQSPYRLGAIAPTSVLVRATDAAGQVIEAKYAHRAWQQILFAIVIGLLLGAVIILIAELIKPAHKKEHHFFHL